MRASTAKMKNFIGSKKLFTFDEGLKNTIEWYKKEKNLFKSL